MDEGLKNTAHPATRQTRLCPVKPCCGRPDLTDPGDRRHPSRPQTIFLVAVRPSPRYVPSPICHGPADQQRTQTSSDSVSGVKVLKDAWKRGVSSLWLTCPATCRKPRSSPASKTSRRYSVKSAKSGAATSLHSVARTKHLPAQHFWSRCWIGSAGSGFRSSQCQVASRREKSLITVSSRPVKSSRPHPRPTPTPFFASVPPPSKPRNTGTPLTSSPP